MVEVISFTRYYFFAVYLDDVKQSCSKSCNYDCDETDYELIDDQWKSLILLIPLRLGGERMNPTYDSCLKVLHFEYIILFCKFYKILHSLGSIVVGTMHWHNRRQTQTLSVLYWLARYELTPCYLSWSKNYQFLIRPNR